MKTLATPDAPARESLRGGAALLWWLLTIVAFNLAQWDSSRWGWLILPAAFGLFQWRRVQSVRMAFYGALLGGVGVYTPHMLFLFTLFGPAAVLLCLVLPLWLAAFVATLTATERRWGASVSAWVAPFLWTGFEYFRSEIYWLKFSWLTLGAAWEPSAVVLPTFGVYGAGFWTMAVAAAAGRLFEVSTRSKEGRRLPWAPALLALALAVAPWALKPAPSTPTSRSIQVAAIQLEFPGEPEVLTALRSAKKAHPEIELIALSEYTFDGSVPHNVLEWCRREQCWLVAGGREWLEGAEARPTAGQPLATQSGPPGNPFRNTAFVVSPEGRIAFSQAKSVPIQFFQDGLPAETQRLWESPWGRIGMAVCYDASYRRVMDPLVSMGAQLLIVPAMDVEDWGRTQHELNAKAMRIRSQEYGLPALRVASSGFSQLLGADGREICRGGFPGQGDLIHGTLHLSTHGRVPLDRWIVLPLTVFTAAWLVALGVSRRRAAGAAVVGQTTHSQ